MTKNDLSPDDPWFDPLQFHSCQIRTFQALRDSQIRSDGDLADTDFAGAFLDVNGSCFDGIPATWGGRATAQI